MKGPESMPELQPQRKSGSKPEAANARISALADMAMQFAPNVDRDHSPLGHVFQAMRVGGVPRTDFETTLHLIVAELRRRSEVKRRAAKRRAPPPLSEGARRVVDEWQTLLAGAKAHEEEMRPPDDDDEEDR